MTKVCALFEDQWAYLSLLPRVSGAAVRELVGEAEHHGRVLCVRIPEAEPDAEEPWRMLPSRRTPETSITGPLPSRVQFVLADELHIDRSALPPLLITRLARLAAFQGGVDADAGVANVPVPVLARMAAKRRAGYEALGYTIDLESRLYESAPQPAVRFLYPISSDGP